MIRLTKRTKILLIADTKAKYLSVSIQYDIFHWSIQEEAIRFSSVLGE